MKFISKENFEYIWAYLTSLLAKKMDNPEDGSDGQVLTKTADGVEWKTVASDFTKEDADKLYQPIGDYAEKSDIEDMISDPGSGEAGQFLAKTASGYEWKTVTIPDECTCEAVDEETLNEMLGILA